MKTSGWPPKKTASTSKSGRIYQSPIIEARKMYTEKSATFTISCTLIPLGATTPSGFQHSGYREEFRLSVNSAKTSFSANIQSIAQGKSLAIAALKQHYPSADISGEIRYFVDLRISERWVKKGGMKQGEISSPYEYQAIKANPQLLNSPFFSFSENDVFGRGLGRIVPLEKGHKKSNRQIGDRPKVMKTYRIDASLAEALETQADSLGTTQVQLLEQAISQLFHGK